MDDETNVDDKIRNPSNFVLEALVETSIGAIGYVKLPGILKKDSNEVSNVSSYSCFIGKDEICANSLSELLQKISSGHGLKFLEIAASDTCINPI